MYLATVVAAILIANLLGALLGYLLGWHRAACGLPILRVRRAQQQRVAQAVQNAALPPQPKQPLTAREFAEREPALRQRVEEDLKVSFPYLTPTDRDAARDELMAKIRQLHVGAT